MNILKLFVNKRNKYKLLQLTKKLIAMYQQFLANYTFDCSNEETCLLFVCENVKVELALFHISPICTITATNGDVIDIVPYLKQLPDSVNMESYIRVITNFLHNFNTICDQHLAVSTIGD